MATIPPVLEELGKNERPRTDDGILVLSEVDLRSSNPSKPSKNHKRLTKRQKKKAEKFAEPCSSEDVLWKDLVSVLGQDEIDKAIEGETDMKSPFEIHQEIEVEVKILGSNGDGIAVPVDSKQPWAVVVPLTLPGERVRTRIYRQARLHSVGDLLEVITPNTTLRDSSRIQCKYFGSCGGCQYQMLSYGTQLEFKREVVVKAFRNYCNILSEQMPTIQPTAPSPLQYGYRTKLTPHFEAPSRKIQKGPRPPTDVQPEWLQIGFNRIGTRKVLDIEECPIASPVINAQIGPTREHVIKTSHTYTKGVSLLFRDSLDTAVDANPDSVDRLSDAFNKHICITNHKETCREQVGDFIFEYNAGSFFQNNNSVLPPLTNYVRDAIFPPSATEPSPLTHLVDTYCGAGLFAIVLSPFFQKVAGIELSQDSIRFATHNAKLNSISEEKISFRSGDAAEIFAVVREFPKDQTAVLIDPPRKGCDEVFIKQLLEFGPKTVVYVSCNVHTQARDIAQIMERGKEEGVTKYRLESVKGFDLFPQTAHVESVAVLRRVD
ncbi:tRNA methyltransferase [Ephemerocybe angulata]|uniref:tRNA methyltransferase n=1 Tax=Ephemerocybe angulata TaxID=980116 RepID=A0A8H6I4W0_9AGAR|nr:tRNA methyltransferase [Tulosesus angulatus]